MINSPEVFFNFLVFCELQINFYGVFDFTGYKMYSELVEDKIGHVKTLESLCKKKLLDVYEFEIDFLLSDDFNYVVEAFQNIGPTFTKVFGVKHDKFEKFLWFLHNFVWKNDEKFYIKDPTLSLSYNWAYRKLRCMSYTISKTNFIGCSYVRGKLCLVLGEESTFKQVEVSPKMFNYEYKFPLETKKSHHKYINLTVINQYWMYELERVNSLLLFDLERGTVFDLYKTIELLGYPAFKCTPEIYTYLIGAIRFCFISKMNYFQCPDDSPCFIRIIRKSSNSLKYVNRTKIKRSSSNLDKLLKSYCFLEEIQLNLLDVPSKEKVSIINSLNKKLKSLKLIFFQPISFLLYIGTKFKNLETLEVVYASKKINLSYCHKFIKKCTYFDKLQNKNLVAFKKLKRLKLDLITYEEDCNPLLLKTVLSILECCHTTLGRFQFENYCFEDVEQIIGYICSKNMPLKYISFREIKCLTDKDVMKIVNLNSCNGCYIEIYNCFRITPPGIKAVLSFIEENNLNIEINQYNIIY